MEIDGNALKELYQINPEINKAKRICIFGTGMNAAYIYEKMVRQGIRVDFFADKKPQSEYKIQYLNLPVLDEDELPGTDCIVIIASSFWEEIANRLINKKIFNLFIAPVETNKKIEIIKDEKYLLSIGDIILRKDIIYICCPCGLGDTLYVAALAKEYKYIYSEVKKVCLIIKEKHMGLVSLFKGVDEIIISDGIVAALHVFSTSTETWNRNNYIYGHFTSDWMEKYIMGIYTGNMISSYKKYIMHLPEECQLEHPQFQKSCDVMTQINKNTIIMMPYAVSSDTLPECFWSEIAEKLLILGYQLYTNTKDDTEKVIPGTKRLSETVDIMAQLCERCFAVISVRSGMCDILGLTNTTLLVINTEKVHSEFWNIESATDNNNIFNFDFYEDKCLNYLEKNIMMTLNSIGVENIGN